jgi:hypothetical protein
VLQKFWLSISHVKTEVVSFMVKPSLRRAPLPVRVGSVVLPRTDSFKYLGVTLAASGSLHLHKRAVSIKARVAAREVSMLFSRLGIRDLFRLRLYLQSFVDSQFYGLELLELPVAGEIDRARKIFMCGIFQLPCSTATNLVYVLFPVVPAVFLLAKRRFAFYQRAQTHDLDCVKEAFLFDMTHLYPHQSSWTQQAVVILKELNIPFDAQRMNFIAGLETASRATNDVELLCFRHISCSTEATLSFFRIFPDPATARDFRTFLSAQGPEVQSLLVLFLSSGLRWRFFHDAARGRCCPLCSCSFWSWEHFLQCAAVSLRSTLFLEFSSAAFHGDWLGLVAGIREVLLVWCSALSGQPLLLTADDVRRLCDSVS